MTMAPDRFSKRTVAALQSNDTDLYLSAASVWEISLKYSRGKLRLPVRPREYVAHYMGRTRTSPLSISMEHAALISELPAHHRDPFDRIIVAQAMLDRLPILTADPQIKQYD